MDIDMRLAERLSCLPYALIRPVDALVQQSLVMAFNAIASLKSDHHIGPDIALSL